MPKNDQIWPKIGINVHFGPGLAGSFGALLVGGCGARAVSRKTPIYFILVFVVIVVIVVAVVVHENKIIMMLPDHLLCYIP